MAQSPLSRALTEESAKGLDGFAVDIEYS